MRNSFYLMCIQIFICYWVTRELRVGYSIIRYFFRSARFRRGVSFGDFFSQSIKKTTEKILECIWTRYKRITRVYCVYLYVWARWRIGIRFYIMLSLLALEDKLVQQNIEELIFFIITIDYYDGWRQLLSHSDWYNNINSW